MAITRTFNLDMIPGKPPLMIHVNQYDADFTLVFNLYASEGTFAIPSGTTVDVRGTKKDGNAYSASATLSGTTVTVTGTAQMTAAAGNNIYEVMLTNNGKQLYSANYVLCVEHAAMDADTVTSESVLKEMNALIDSAATATAAAQVAQNAASSVSSSLAQIQTNTNNITALQEAISGITEAGLSDEAKYALLACFEHVAWAGNDGQDYYDNLNAALFATAEVTRIGAVFAQGGNVIYDTDSLDVLREYLIVTAYYNDSTTQVVNGYTLSGTLEEGVSTITVRYSGKTDTFNVTVTAELPSGYTKYDYIVGTAGSTSGNTMVASSAAQIAITNLGDLNVLSYFFDFDASTSINYPGTAIFGGRTVSGATNSCALYLATSTRSVSLHDHGVNIDATTFLPNVVNFDQRNSVSFVRNATSPSVLTVNGQSASNAWQNTNVVDTPITIFSNPAPTDANRYNGNKIKLGTLTIKNVAGDIVSRLVPVKRNSDNVIGLYDTKRSTFFTTATASYATIGNANCIYAVGNWD